MREPNLPLARRKVHRWNYSLTLHGTITQGTVEARSYSEAHRLVVERFTRDLTIRQVPER